MVEPVMLAVNDDPQLLRVVRQDLRRRCAREHRRAEAPRRRIASSSFSVCRQREERWKDRRSGEG